MTKVSIRLSELCHYCNKQGRKDVLNDRMTEDHVVPRKLLPSPLVKLPYWYRQWLTVPSCWACNNKKAWWRSNCNCWQCTWLWDVAIGRGWLNIPIDEIPVIHMTYNKR